MLLLTMHRISECMTLHYRARRTRAALIRLARRSHDEERPPRHPLLLSRCERRDKSGGARDEWSGVPRNLFGSASLLILNLFDCPPPRMRERVAGAVHAMAARMQRDGRVRAGGRPRPGGVECCDAAAHAASNFGGHNTPPPRVQHARLSSVWHAGRRMKSDQRAIHLLSPSERRDKTTEGVAFARGFTLLELAVVMFLMGLMLLIAMPFIGGVTDGQLKSVPRASPAARPFSTMKRRHASSLSNWSSTWTTTAIS